MKTGFLLLLCASNIWSYSPFSEPRHVRKQDQPLVNRALDMYGMGKVSRAELLEEYDVVVVYLPKMSCVGLNLRPGTMGGDTTMCFDRSGEFLGYYVNGD